MVLYVHRTRVTLLGTRKNGIGSESPGPPPCSHMQLLGLKQYLRIRRNYTMYCNRVMETVGVGMSECVLVCMCMNQ